MLPRASKRSVYEASFVAKLEALLRISKCTSIYNYVQSVPAVCKLEVNTSKMQLYGPATNFRLLCRSQKVQVEAHDTVTESSDWPRV